MPPDLEPFIKWFVMALALSPIWGALLLHLWELNVKTRLIPMDEIKALADTLIAEHGPRAEETAFIAEDRAWRYCETFQQGKWRRVRREVRRRYDAGEWDGPES